MKFFPKPSAPSLAGFPWASLGRRESLREFEQKCRDQRGRVGLIAPAPRISIIVPVTSSIPPANFELTLQSLREQTYSQIDVLVLGGRGTSVHRSIVESLGDERFRARTLDPTPTQAALKNRALEETKGDWWGIVDAGDVLSPVAIYLAVIEINAKEAPDLVYTNEAVVDESLKSITSFLSKPEFSWFDLAHLNYLGRFWLVRRSLAEQAGNFDEATGAHHEQDFLLRLCERSEHFRLCPYFAYYRRTPFRIEGANAKQIELVKSHLARKGLAADVLLNEKTKKGTRLRVTPRGANLESQTVSAIICFRDRSDWTIRSLENLARQRGKAKLEVFLVDNGSRADERAKVQAVAGSFDFPVSLLRYDGAFNFAAMHNLVVRNHCRGEFVFLLNNDVFLSGSHQLDDLVAWAGQRWVGTVGILLRYPEGGVQHAGLRALYGGEARLARVGNSQQEDIFSLGSREVFGNSFAACLLRKETYLKVGGLREVDYPNGFGDVIFNFECLRHGLKNLYLGYIEGVHMESASRGVDYEYWEECGIEREYPDILQKMLRADLGFDRVPGGDFKLKSLVRQAIGQTVRERMAWLQPLEPHVRRLIKQLPFS